MSTDRSGQTIPILFEDGETIAKDTQNLSRGCFGTIVVPAGSSAAGKDIQFIAVANEQGRGTQLPDTDLLTTPKTLSEGSNPLTADELTEVGAANYTKFSLDTAVSGDTTIYLLWKS